MTTWVHKYTKTLNSPISMGDPESLGLPPSSTHLHPCLEHGLVIEGELQLGLIVKLMAVLTEFPEMIRNLN